VKGRILAAQGDCTGASVAFGKSIGFDSAYPVPWPGFGSASEDLAALNTTCTPAPAIPGPAKSPLGLSVIAAALSAAVVFGMRK